MADVENVIKAWNCCNPFNRKCKECPYEKDCYHDGISRHMVADALSVIEEQQGRIDNMLSLLGEADREKERLKEEIELLKGLLHQKEPKWENS